MDNKELRKHLQQLQDEIKKTSVVDEKGNELLRNLDGDIHKLLDRSEENPIQVHPSIVQRLKEARDHFEVTHTNLTERISVLLETLSNLGI